MGQEIVMTKQNEATQGAAVAKALEGDRSKDIDRWDGFSRADAAKLAGELGMGWLEERAAKLAG